MMRSSLYFTAPREVRVRQEEVPPPGRDEVQVRSLVSGISAGTEMLFYRGQVDEGTPLDTNIPSLSGGLRRPFKYGYSTVGVVERVGGGLPASWEGRTVFSFHSHESRFNIVPAEVVPVPPGIGTEDAVMLPSMETALSLVMDAAPIVGERAVVLGQGTIGLLTTAVLAMMPLASLVTADLLPLRRERGLSMGADRTFDPSRPEAVREAVPEPVDLVMELSGNPRALELATRLAGHEGRVVVGSWYGNRALDCSLGEDFHRKRLRIISSQVSRIDGFLSPRWTKERRMEVAWNMVRRVAPSRLITHRTPIEDAPSAYRLLDENGAEVLQIVLTYPED
ncbi:MAG: zinc-binding alcohol dehydrogenase [Methanomassiliicoccus sp.]|nr:zinc-binding alcohol dehydrogenase [Methanomassiliicoccus sp.]